MRKTIHAVSFSTGSNETPEQVLARLMDLIESGEAGVLPVKEDRTGKPAKEDVKAIDAARARVDELLSAYDDLIEGMRKPGDEQKSVEDRPDTGSTEGCDDEPSFFRAVGCLSVDAMYVPKDENYVIRLADGTMTVIDRDAFDRYFVIDEDEDDCQDDCAAMSILGGAEIMSTDIDDDVYAVRTELPNGSYAYGVYAAPTEDEARGDAWEDVSCTVRSHIGFIKKWGRNGIAYPESFED